MCYVFQSFGCNSQASWAEWIFIFTSQPARHLACKVHPKKLRKTHQNLSLHKNHHPGKRPKLWTNLSNYAFHISGKLSFCIFGTGFSEILNWVLSNFQTRRSCFTPVIMGNVIALDPSNKETCEKLLLLPYYVGGKSVLGIFFQTLRRQFCQIFSLSGAALHQFLWETW